MIEIERTKTATEQGIESLISIAKREISGMDLPDIRTMATHIMHDAIVLAALVDEEMERLGGE